MSELINKIFNDLGAEGKRLATQGAMELASALFQGHAFVPYGPGQYTPSPSPAQEAQHNQEQNAPEQTNQQERGGMER